MEANVLDVGGGTKEAGSCGCSHFPRFDAGCSGTAASGSAMATRLCARRPANCLRSLRRRTSG